MRRSFYADLKNAEIVRGGEDGRSLDVHSLRKTFGLLARAGVPLTTTQRLMRHSTPELTARLYIDVDPILRDRGYVPFVSEKGYRNHPLTDEQKASNRIKSSVRCRVEHVFGEQKMRMGNEVLRSIGVAPMVEKNHANMWCDSTIISSFGVC